MATRKYLNKMFNFGYGHGIQGFKYLYHREGKRYQHKASNKAYTDGFIKGSNEKRRLEAYQRSVYMERRRNNGDGMEG